MQHWIIPEESALIQQVIPELLSYFFLSHFFYLGNVYITDYLNQRVRKVTVSTGILTTIAGTGTGGYSGDNGPATSATLNSPTGVSLDTAGTHWSLFCLKELFIYSLHHLGNVYIGDTQNNRVRKVTVSTGIISTIAGTGSTTFSDNGPATSGTLYYPFGVVVDSAGKVMLSLFSFS